MINVPQQVTFYCNNNHPTPLPMKIKEGNSKFYACPHFMRKDNVHPDGYIPGVETACTNQLALSDAGDIIYEFSKLQQEDIMNGEVANDYTSLVFSLPHRKIKVKVLKYTDEVIHFGVINTAAVRR